MTNTMQSMPVVMLSVAPRRGADAKRFASGIREYATRLHAAGVVLVSSHWTRVSDAASVIVEVDDLRPDEGPAFSSELPVPSASAFALTERVAELLQENGLSAEFGRTWPRDNATWAAMLDAHAGAAFPVIHVSVPARFGADLMRDVTRALQPMREEGVLLVGISIAFADAIREGARRGHEEYEFADAFEGVPV